VKIGFVSLGCPKNLVDSETMLGIIAEYQMEITNDPAAADVIIVNTCGFIEAAKEESINTILQMAAYKKTGHCKYLIVTGCLVQRYAEDLFREMPEVDALVGTNVYEDIALVIKKVMAGERVLHLQKSPEFEAAKAAQQVSKTASAKVVAAETGIPVQVTPRKLTTPSYLAYLKIAEGCDNRCSYCAIPFIRGPYVSKPYEQVMAEAKALVAGGVKELILVAQDTSRYGIDLYGSFKLAALLKDLNALPGLKWIRVLYLYPNSFTDELIEAFATLPKVCKYVDIPLQHASDRLLHAMHRFDKRVEVEQLLAKMRRRIPNLVIRTTFIVGFPGETDADFAELLDFAKQQRFENAGVFKYSREENTEAATMPNQIAPEIMEERYQQLMAQQARISEELHQAEEGQVLEVVVEGFEEGETNLARGRSYHEAPDIDGNIFIENAVGLQTGDFVQVKMEQGFTYELVGTLVS
jgi:ribosomal protein S12 methylthiotransferase